MCLWIDIYQQISALSRSNDMHIISNRSRSEHVNAVENRSRTVRMMGMLVEHVVRVT